MINFKNTLISACLLFGGLASGNDINKKDELLQLGITPQSIRSYLEDLVAISESAGGNQMGVRLNKAGDDVANYLYDAYKAIGLNDVELEEFYPNRWWPESYSTYVLESDGSKTSLDVFPLWQTQSIDAQELELVSVGFGSEGELFAKDLKGKAVLLDMKRLLHFLPSYNFNRALEKIVEKGAKFVLLADTRVDAPSGNTLGSSGELVDLKASEPNLYSIPVFSTGKNVGEMLKEKISKGKAYIEVELRHSLKPSSASNVVARLPGNGQIDETVVIGGHYDSWFNGALDNLASQAILIELAHYFQSIPRDSRPRDIIFVALFGHEMRNEDMGHAAFLQHHPELKGKITAFIDVDGSGSWGWEELGDTGSIFPTNQLDKGGIFASSWAMASLAHEAIYKYSKSPENQTSWGSFPLNLFVADLEGPFQHQGLPHLLMISKHIYYHTRFDTLDRIHPNHSFLRLLMTEHMISKLLNSPEGYYIGVDENNDSQEVSSFSKPTIDDLPKNPTPWLDQAPKDLMIHIIPNDITVFSTVIAWPGFWKSDAILSPNDVSWKFGGIVELIKGSGPNFAAGTKYLIPGKKTIKFTVTDSLGRETAITREIQVKLGLLGSTIYISFFTLIGGMIFGIFRFGFRKKKAKKLRFKAFSLKPILRT